jgi:hypothetical protein
MPTPDCPGDDAARRQVLDAIRSGARCYSTVASLRRAGAIGTPRGAAGRAIAGLLRDQWLETWRPAGGARVATFTPLGAAALGLALIQPEDDADEEPRWGRAGADPSYEGNALDRTGRYLDEPEHFTITLDWGPLKRSLTRFEAVLRWKRSKGKAADPLLRDDDGEPVVILGQVVRRDARIR